MTQNYKEKELQTKTQQRIILLSHCAVIFFCTICLVSITTIEHQNTFTVTASCMFVIAMACFSSTVLAKLFLVYKAGNRRSHITLNKKSIKIYFLTGLGFTIAGTILLTSQISLWTVLVLLLSVLLLGYSFLSLTNHFNSLNDAVIYSENLFKKTYSKVKRR